MLNCMDTPITRDIEKQNREKKRHDPVMETVSTYSTEVPFTGDRDDGAFTSKGPDKTKE